MIATLSHQFRVPPVTPSNPHLTRFLSVRNDCSPAVESSSGQIPTGKDTGKTRFDVLTLSLEENAASGIIGENNNVL